MSLIGFTLTSATLLLIMSSTNVVWSSPVNTTSSALPWESPCGVPSMEQKVFKMNSNTTLSAPELTNSTICLKMTREDTQDFKRKMSIGISNRNLTRELDKRRLTNFPTPRQPQSDTSNHTLILLEDYESLAKIFIFVENSRLDRERHMESENSNHLLLIESKFLKCLCLLLNKGIRAPSLTRDLAKAHEKPGNRAGRDQRDYILAKDIVILLESLN